MTPCIEFDGARGLSGYGIAPFKIAGTRLAHQIAWILAFGEVPDGLFVCHRCDNPPCINPEHLFVGSQSDNERDASSKGRKGGRYGRQKYSYPVGLTPRERDLAYYYARKEELHGAV